MKNSNDVISGIVLVCLAIAGAFSVGAMPEASGNEVIGPAHLPATALIAVAVCGLLLIAFGLRFQPRKKYWENPHAIKKVFIFFALFVIYLIAMVFIGDWLTSYENFPFAHNSGFVVSTLLFLLVALPCLGRSKPLEVGLVSIITTSCLVVAFGYFFQVILP